MSQAGKYREQIELIAPAPLVQDATGGFCPAPMGGSLLGSGTFPFVLGGVTTIAVSSLTWAKVETLSANEVLENGKLTYKQPYRITIRWTEAVTNTYAVVWRGKTIAINSVVEDVRWTEKVLIGYGE